MKAHWLWYLAALLALAAGFVTLSRGGDVPLAVAYLVAALFLFVMGDSKRRRRGGDNAG